MQAASAQVSAVIRDQGVDLSISMWSNAISTLAHTIRDGSALSCFEAIDPPHPHLQYWLDAPHWAHAGSVREMLPSGIFKSRWLLNVVNNEPIAEEMRRILHFGHAMALPYGINPDVFRPFPAIPMPAREFDVAFTLGPGSPPPTPRMLAELDRDDPAIDAIRAEEAAKLAPRLDELAARSPSHRDSMRSLFAELLAAQLASRQTPMLDRVEALRSFRPDLLHAIEVLLADPALYIDATAIVRTVESFERAFTFAFLARRFRCLLVGQSDADAWGVRSTGFCAHEQQAAAYSRARFGLSVMRWQDEHGINLKPLEIGASGAVPLVAERVGLDHILTPGLEAAVFTGPAHAARLVRELSADPSRLERLTQHCRGRILRDHTWKTRSQALLGPLGAWTGRW